MKNCKVRLDFDEIKEIGQEGRNSKVFLAHDNQLDGEIVIKEIAKRRNISYDEYFKEARLLYAHNHNNIVKVNYACEDDDNIYIAMPYYKNGSLKKQISKGKCLTIRETIRYSIQFLSGLNHIHSRGLIHYDIKPDNIMISNSNEAMLADFGLALYTNPDGFADQKYFYTLHASPEMLLPNVKQTILSDIYQAGITMYRMVNGNDFFYSQCPESKEQFISQVLKGTFPNRKTYLPHVPSRLRKIIKKCIDPNPAKRYNNTLEIINDLASIDENMDIEYSKLPNAEIWTTFKNDWEYRIVLKNTLEKSDIHVSKTKEEKTTNCPRLCYKNIDNTEIESRLEAIFASL